MSWFSSLIAIILSLIVINLVILGLMWLSAAVTDRHRDFEADQDGEPLD